MTARPFVLRPADRASPLNVVGEHITVLASGATTGSYEIFLQEGPQGSGPVPHSHPWDESFFVTQGEVDFSLEDGEKLTATVGTLVHVPAGAKHWFRWRAGGGAMLSMTSRRGASAMFTDIHQAIAPERPDVDKLVEIALRHGLQAHAA